MIDEALEYTAIRSGVEVVAVSQDMMSNYKEKQLYSITPGFQGGHLYKY